LQACKDTRFRSSTTTRTERGSQANHPGQASIMTPLITDRTIQLADLTLHYREAGDPNSPPLILLHALLSNAQNWDEISSMLAERYHVYALDQRGHGESDRPGTYSFELMRDDLKAFVGALSLDRFILIGHSMGGTVAYLFAESWPERIERLVFEDTPPPLVGAMDLNSPEPPDEPPASAPLEWQQNWPVVKSIVRQLRHPNLSWWNDLSRITAPTLIIAGGSTSHVPQDKLAEVAQQIPDCRLVTIEGAGHTVHKNRPQQYKDLLRDFLFR
jgi:esterase